MRKLLLLFILILFSCEPGKDPKIVIIISANAEWKVVKSLFPNEKYQPTPWGEFFPTEIENQGKKTPVIFFHEGWGKTAAAGGTQYAIDRWSPEYLINIGTCGGFEGR